MLLIRASHIYNFYYSVTYSNYRTCIHIHTHWNSSHRAIRKCSVSE